MKSDKFRYSKNRSNLSNLNFNLKNIIFSYLPFLTQITILNNVDKTCLFAIQNEKSYSLISNEFDMINGLFDAFDFEKILNLLKKYEGIIKESNKFFYEMSVYFLTRKFKEENHFDLSYIKSIEKEESIFTQVFSYITGSLEINCTIVKLYFENKNLGKNTNNLKNLSRVLKKNWSIIEIYLNENFLGENIENIQLLSEALKINKGIKSLYLSSNQLGKFPENLLCLSEALKLNNTLEILDLGINDLGYNKENLLHLSESLKVNNSIKEIYLNDNFIGNALDNIIYLCEAIEADNKLKEINLNSNNLAFDKLYVEMLLNSLIKITQKNKLIKVVYLRWNNIQDNQTLEKYLNQKLEYEKYIIINY